MKLINMMSLMKGWNWSSCRYRNVVRSLYQADLIMWGFHPSMTWKWKWEFKKKLHKKKPNICPDI
jgi:hypothetical protein